MPLFLPIEEEKLSASVSSWESFNRNSIFEFSVQGKTKVLNYGLGLQEENSNSSDISLYRYSVNIHPMVQYENLKIRFNSELSGLDHRVGTENFSSTTFFQYTFSNSNWSTVALLGNERLTSWELIPGFSYNYTSAKMMAFLGFPINILIYRFQADFHLFAMATPSDLRTHIYYSLNDLNSLQFGYTNVLRNFLGRFEKEKDRIEERVRTVFFAFQWNQLSPYNFEIQIGAKSSSGLNLKEANSKLTPEQGYTNFAKLTFEMTF